MKRVPVAFLTVALLALVQSALQAFAQSAGETKRQTAASGVYSQNPEANELFLKARDSYGKSDPRTGGSLDKAREAIKLYEQALKKDPKLALAYVGTARAWTVSLYLRTPWALNRSSCSCGRVRSEIPTGLVLR